MRARTGGTTLLALLLYGILVMILLPLATLALMLFEVNKVVVQRIRMMRGYGNE